MTKQEEFIAGLIVSDLGNRVSFIWEWSSSVGEDIRDAWKEANRKRAQARELGFNIPDEDYSKEEED